MATREVRITTVLTEFVTAVKVDHTAIASPVTGYNDLSGDDQVWYGPAGPNPRQDLARVMFLPWESVSTQGSDIEEGAPLRSWHEAVELPFECVAPAVDDATPFQRWLSAANVYSDMKSAIQTRWLTGLLKIYIKTLTFEAKIHVTGETHAPRQAMVKGTIRFSWIAHDGGT